MTLTADRQVASRLLLEQTLDNGRLDPAMHDRTRGLQPTERRRVHALVYGVNRTRSLLASHLEPFLAKPLDRQDAEVQVALLLGTYELLYHDSVPDRAAVDQAVELMRSFGQEKRTGLINAVLRRVARREQAPELPDRGEEPLRWAEVAASHPRWLVNLMATRVPPEEVAAWAAVNNCEPPLVIRLRDPDDSEVVERLGGTRSTLVPGAVRLDARPPGPIPELFGFAEGRWWVQDLGAQAVVGMLGLEPGMRVLDACAAPGGKALAAAVAVGPAGRVVAVDRSSARLNKLSRSLDRLKLGNVEIRAADLLEGPEFGQSFDAVLLDAPCSGLGVLRRHPEIRWTRRKKDLARHGSRQASLLDATLELMGPEGTLVYAVCTFARQECDAVLEGACSDHPELRIVDPRLAAPTLDPSLFDGPLLRTYPHRHDADAFFAVRFDRGTPR